VNHLVIAILLCQKFPSTVLEMVSTNGCKTLLSGIYSSGIGK